MSGSIKTEDDSFVVPVIDFSRNAGSSSGSWVARNIVKDTEGKDVSLYMNSMYHQESPDVYYAIGIYIKGGIGSPDQPYSFDVVLSPKPLVNVSIEFGAGHGELATAVASALPDYMQASASGTTITMKYPAIDDDVKTHKLGTVLTYIKDQALAKLSNKKDNNELFLAAAPKAINSYSSKAAIEQDLETAKTTPVNTEGDNKVYLIWESPLSQIDVTIAEPVAGTKVRCSSDKGYDQSTRPNLTINSDHMAIRMITAGETTVPALNYKTENDDFYAGIMEEGKEYTIYASVVCDFPYYFADQLTLTVNGTAAPASEPERYNDETMNFYHPLLAIKRQEYYPEKGDGLSWTKGSGVTADFSFKQTEEDEGTFEKFRSLDVDDMDLGRPGKNYTAEAGSLIIRLQPAYLETLAVGKHNITVYFKDGNASASFTILEQKEEKKDSDKSETKYAIPKTGIE